MNVAPTPSLVAPSSPSQVQESRTKRLVRQQARFRDRGGIFVPRTHNNLLDILLGRKKLSPLKERSRSRSRSRSVSVSPTKRLSRGPSVGRKSGGIASKSASQKKSKILVGDRDEEPEQSVAGPSRLPDAAKKPPRKAAASRKGKKAVPADDDTPVENKPAPKRKGRVPKSKQPIEEPIKTTTKPTTKRKTKAAPPDEPAVRDSDDEARPGPSKKRTTVSKSKTSQKTAEADEPDPEVGETSKPSRSSAKSTVKASSPATAPKPRAKPKARSTKVPEDTEVDADPPPRTQRSRAVKSRQIYAELSDDDDDEEPLKASASRGKKTAAVPSAKDSADPVPVSAKRLGKQREVDDDVITETPTVGKAKGKGKLREQEVEKLVKPKAKTTARKRALEPDLPEDDDNAEGDRPAKKRKAVPPPPKEDASRKRLEVIMEEDEEEEVASVETPAPSGSSTAEDPKAISDSVTPASKSKKRLREQNEDASAQTTRKRAKVKEVKEAPAAPSKTKKRAPAKRSKPPSKLAEKEGKQTLKENTSTSLTLPEQQKPAAKPASVVKQKGPPKSVLDRVRAHGGSTLVADDEPDEIDFLS
ncbi:hypothetical protein B0H19DRAFT_1262879 [Mycena capillaripes]|nr:hypothetical protein B0H19DRAFT_1262879 [Mycena capillaripes]